MPAIRWTKSDGGENWSSINGYVGDKLRFHIVGERFGSKCNSYDLHRFGVIGITRTTTHQLQSGAKLTAQKIIDKENS